MESGWNVWVLLLGVVVRRYIDFLTLLIPTPLVSIIFAAVYISVRQSGPAGPCTTRKRNWLIEIQYNDINA